MRGKNISYFRQKLAFLTLLETNILGLGCYNPTMQLPGRTVIVSKEITRGCLSW